MGTVAIADAFLVAGGDVGGAALDAFTGLGTFSQAESPNAQMPEPWFRKRHVHKSRRTAICHEDVNGRNFGAGAHAVTRTTDVREST